MLAVNWRRSQLYRTQTKFRTLLLSWKQDAATVQISNYPHSCSSTIRVSGMTKFKIPVIMIQGPKTVSPSFDLTLRGFGSVKFQNHGKFSRSRMSVYNELVLRKFSSRKIEFHELQSLSTLAYPS